MYILAFKDGHDPAACIFKDGELIAACEEERFTRQKHAPSVFPLESIRFCLSYAGVNEEDIDYVAYARLRAWETFFKVFSYYIFHPPKSRLQFIYAKNHLLTQIRGMLRQAQGTSRHQKLHKLFSKLPNKLYTYEHHLAHAASAYYFSGFSESLILTIDGKGEATSVTIGKGEKEKIILLEKRGIFESFGLFYSGVTQFLGFTPNDGEYKVMGLAPYGKPTINISNILRPDKIRGYILDRDFALYPYSLNKFIDKFGTKRKKEDEIRQKDKNLAASSQKALEDSMCGLIRYALKKYKSKNLCLAGGVALNVKMNKVLRESGLVENIFIQPAAGDDGLVLGAGALLYKEKSGKSIKPSATLYLGPEFGGEEVSRELKNSKLVYHKSDNPIKEATNLLKNGKVIGWFQGRMEFGPRALGNRSILAHPGIKGMRERVNQKIKFREDFRPFCPSVLREHAEKFLVNYAPSPYMIMSFDVEEGYIGDISEVVHVDKTVRPQTVSGGSNPIYYALIKSFYKETGIPVLLNTSMNIRGEPIVCTPRDGILFFKKTNVDALVIGDFVILRERQKKENLKTLSRETLSPYY